MNPTSESVPTPLTATLSQPALERWGRTVGSAAVVGRTLSLPLVIALRGPLGAGKSVLARAVARGAGVESAMPSPTYNLLFSYAGAAGAEVVHLDLYRLDDPEDVWELGWQELGEGRQLVLIEWPERAEELLPPDRWDVELAPVDEAADAADAPGVPVGVDSTTLRELRVRRVGAAPAPAPLPEEGG